jgi:hypothetical protein
LSALLCWLALIGVSFIPAYVLIEEGLIMSFSIVVLFVGAGLLILGGASGVALFSRALKTTPMPAGNETNVGTLWGLFLLGLTMGLTLIYFALRAQQAAQQAAAALAN